MKARYTLEPRAILLGFRNVHLGENVRGWFAEVTERDRFSGSDKHLIGAPFPDDDDGKTKAQARALAAAQEMARHRAAHGKVIIKRIR